MKFPVFVHTMVSFLCFIRYLWADDSGKIHFTNSWAVHIENGSDDIAREIAKKHGFSCLGQIGSLPGYFHFVKKEKQRKRRRRAIDQTFTLLTEEKIKWVEQQHILERDKRSIVPDYLQIIHPVGYTIQDPLYNDQWYLNNVGQSSGPPGLDINVIPVWAQGVSGKDIVVAVLDDGLDHTHPDLKRNYDPKASYDFNDYDEDPMPRVSDPNNCHGTKCAGEVAAEAGNGICGVGVAFNSSVGGIRMLDGNTTDTIEGSALSFKKDYIDIYSCAWGPKDDGKRFGRPGTLASKALELGAKEGRKGLGSIFVWATGNGGLTDDDCNCDGYTTSVYTISVGAISDHGLSTYYTESCASTLAVTYSGGSHREKRENKIVTTTLNHKCTDEFKGTSSAAPLAAGMIALMLEANHNLTWRDVQYIIVETSLMTSPLDEGWRRNGAGKWFNQKFGFGRMDAASMIEKAYSWSNVVDHRLCWSDKSVGPWAIPSSGTILSSINTTACSETLSEIKTLEHVQVVLSLKHRHRGHLSVELISPSGTRTQLLKTRRNDKSTKGLKDWVFMSVHFWGEDPKGVWTLSVTDNSNNNREHHREKTKYGDFEDATEAMQDELESTGGKDSEHETIVEEADQFVNTEEFENNVFDDNSYRKKEKSKQDKEEMQKEDAARKEIEREELKIKSEKMRKEKMKLKEIEEIRKVKKRKAAAVAAALKKKKKTAAFKKKKHDQQVIESEESDDDLVDEILGQGQESSKNTNSYAVPPYLQNANQFNPNTPPMLSQVMPTSVAPKPFLYPPPVAQNAYQTPQIISPTNASYAKVAMSPVPQTSLSASGETNKSVSAVANGTTSVPLSDENKMLENVLKTVLSETFANFRSENEGGLKNFEDRLNDLENALHKNNSKMNSESVTASLAKAFKSGKAIDKINNVLGVLENSKNHSKSTNTSFYKNSEVVGDVLKVLKDILSTNKDDRKLKRYKERISKLLETGSNSTRKLTNKLFSDLEPQNGKDVSASVITDAMALVSHIFKKKSQPTPKMKTMAKLPKDVRIVLQGPKGNVVLPYEMVTTESNNKKEVTTLTSSKELHHSDNSVDTITVEHKNVRKKPKHKNVSSALKERYVSKDEVKEVEGRKGAAEDNEEVSGEEKADDGVEVEGRPVSAKKVEADSDLPTGEQESGSEKEISGGEDPDSFTISVMKDGKMMKKRKVKPKTLYFDRPKEEYVDDDLLKKKNMLDNIDVEVMFDKDDDHAEKPGNYENLDEIKKLESRESAMDVSRFGAQDDSGRFDHREDVVGRQWQPTSSGKHSKTLTFEVGSKREPKHNSPKKKTKPAKKVATQFYHRNDDQYNFDALPFLQFSDPTQLTQIPVNAGDDNFIQSLYEPYKAHDNSFEENRPYQEKASLYHRNVFQNEDFTAAKRSKIYQRNGTKSSIENAYDDYLLPSKTIYRRRRSRRSLDVNDAFDEEIIRQKRSDIEDESEDDDDDGPHVVKRSAIFSDLYPSQKPDVSGEESVYSPAFDGDSQKRSAIKKAYTLEGKLKRKLISMRKESSSVLDVIKRVHDDISVGDSKDLRKLEKQLSQLESAKYYSNNYGDNEAKPKTPLVRTKVSKKPLQDPKEDPDEYYKYGVTSSGELETWTLLFYGTGP